MQTLLEQYHKAAKAGDKSREESLKIAYEKAKLELEKVYKSLRAEVEKKLKNGYAIQLKEFETLKNQK